MVYKILRYIYEMASYLFNWKSYKDMVYKDTEKQMRYKDTEKQMRYRDTEKQRRYKDTKKQSTQI